MGETYVENLFGNYQKSRTVTNDVYYTPDDLAKLVVKTFRPRGKKLEPFAGKGVFLKYLKNADWCELSKGKNFFSYREKVDWIVTTPPFSKLTNFLIHSMNLSNNIVFILYLQSLFTNKRVREIHNNGFGIKTVLYLKQPDTWQQTGRQLAAVHLKKGYRKLCEFKYSKDFNKPYKRFKR